MPAAGSWLTTSPAATVSLYASVASPTVRPAAVMVSGASAAAPLRSGTATVSRPRLMTWSTAEPRSAMAPAWGDWLMTSPAATVSLKASVRVPGTRPASSRASRASASVRSTMSGTATCSGPMETV